ncbi:MAG: META domain-containing protein [Ferruginibacter sp.]
MKKLFFFFCTICFFACNTTKQTSQKNIDIAKYSSKLSDSLSLKQAAGIDFSATGTNPVNWQLDVDFDKNIVFKADDGMQLTTTAIGASTTSGSTTTYNANTPNGMMKMIVDEEACSTQNSKKTTVLLNEKQYTGCGKYLYDYRINDSWVLESAGGKMLSAADFSKGLPQILFSIAENKLTGSDGCNSISMPFELLGNRVKFGALSSSKKSCKNNTVALIFQNKLSNSVASYYFTNGEFYLYLIDDSILTFRKNN